MVFVSDFLDQALELVQKTELGIRLMLLESVVVRFERDNLVGA